MNDTIRHMAKILGASGVEGAGHDARFSVEGARGDRLKVSLEIDTQRLMAVLTDSAGVTRCTLDVAPVAKAIDDLKTPGRVTLHVGKLLVHLDSKPTLAIEVLSND